MLVCSINTFFPLPKELNPYFSFFFWISSKVFSVKSDLFTKKLIFATQNIETANKTQQQSFLGMMEVVRILGMADEGIYQLAVKSAFIEDYNNNAIASCGDVGKNTGVMYFKLGEENRIYTDNGCIVIEGKDAEGLMKSSEKFAYHLLKVF